EYGDLHLLCLELLPTVFRDQTHPLLEPVFERGERQAGKIPQVFARGALGEADLVRGRHFVEALAPLCQKDGVPTRRFIDTEQYDAGVLLALAVLGTMLQERIQRGQRHVELAGTERPHAFILIVVLLVVEVGERNVLLGERLFQTRLSAERAVARPRIAGYANGDRTGNDFSLGGLHRLRSTGPLR